MGITTEGNRDMRLSSRGERDKMGRKKKSEESILPQLEKSLEKRRGAFRLEERDAMLYSAGFWAGADTAHKWMSNHPQANAGKKVSRNF
jgi:hypothetical protein